MLASAQRGNATYDYKPVDDLRWEKAQKIRRVCDAHGVDLRAAALQFPLRHPCCCINHSWSLANGGTEVEFKLS